MLPATSEGRKTVVIAISQMGDIELTKVAEEFVDEVFRRISANRPIEIQLEILNALFDEAKTRVK